MATVSIQRSQARRVPTQNDDVTPSGSAAPLVFRNAVVLKKSTRWQWEKETTGLDDAELRKQLQSKGLNVNEMLENDRKQKNAVREIVSRLEQAGIPTRVVSRAELQEVRDQADIIISAGGDGTFLTAAALVNDNTPIIGINTDPVGSEGHLCVGGKAPPNDLIEQLIAGKLKWSRRSRIRVTVKDAARRCQPKKSTTNLALNEVFIGEDEAAKVSTYNISIDDSPSVKQKSSGLIVTTGTGSTSWYLGMNRVDESTVTSILEVMKSMAVKVPSNKNFVTAITKKYNEKIPFEPDHPNFAFSIREPIFNGTFKRTATKGYARKIKLESRCTNGFLVLDGSNKIPFPRGSVATLEIFDSDSLTTVI